MSRQNQALVTVTVDGVNLGTWENRTGGQTDSSDTQYRLGGMGPRISLGGVSMVDNVVCSKLWDDDIRSRKAWLRGRVGKGKAVVTDHQLDADGNPTGEPDVYSGTLKRFAPPERNAESDSAATCEIEVSISGNVG